MIAEPPPGEARPMERLTAVEIVSALDLSPHPEGGYFRETYRAERKVSTPDGERSASTAILYLLGEGEISHFHRLRSDELWFYHSGALVELVLLGPSDRSQSGAPADLKVTPEIRMVGPESPYELVPAGWWVAARAAVGGQTHRTGGTTPERREDSERQVGGEVDWSLVSCVVTPGFEYEDFEMGEREVLLREFPLAAEVIKAFT